VVIITFVATVGIMILVATVVIKLLVMGGGGMLMMFHFGGIGRFWRDG
jgi:hypothetical protein